MKKIIIFCPANVASGGPELLHQLCFCLRKLGYDACMLYINYDKSNYTNPVMQEYTYYNTPYILKYRDNSDNICIVPEVYSRYFYKIKKGMKVFWWLSVDNYYFSDFYCRYINNINSYKYRVCYGFRHYLKKIFNRTYSDIWSGNIIHFVQSHYAYNHCKNNGVIKSKIYYLSDYLNEAYIENAKNEKNYTKHNYILYNPKKGFKFTNRLMQKSKNMEWIPLLNLSRARMSELMKKSKVYIDFGNHPGKDRIPREAAISGCCIITGKRGAARFREDVNIPDEFKFEDDFNNIDCIIDKINYIFDNYTTEREKFSGYRKSILNEEKKFVSDASNIFEKLVNR